MNSNGTIGAREGGHAISVAKVKGNTSYKCCIEHILKKILWVLRKRGIGKENIQNRMGRTCNIITLDSYSIN